MNIKSRLEAMKYDLGIMEDIVCSEPENQAYRAMLAAGQPLPEGIFCANPEDYPEAAVFFTVREVSLPSELVIQYILHKQSRDIKIIKGCVIFFTVLASLSLLGSLIALLSML